MMSVACFPSSNIFFKKNLRYQKRKFSVILNC
jgi:hypothetical protein